LLLANLVPTLLKLYACSRIGLVVALAGFLRGGHRSSGSSSGVAWG